MKNRYVLFIFYSAAVSCCKEETVIDPCQTQISGSLTHTAYKFAPGYFSNPSFNPHNPDEIAFKQGDVEAGQPTGIGIFNLSTGEKRLVFEGNSYSGPDWGSTGYIIFTQPDYNIWRINSEATELLQLTNTGCYHGTCWSPSGSHFRTNGALCDNGSGAQLLTAQGALVTTYSSGSGNSGDWNEDSLICSLDYMGLIITNPISESSENLTGYVQLHEPGGGGACWLNDREIIWASIDGIFITDYISHATQIIKSSCFAHTYHGPTYSVELDKVIWQKIEKVALGPVYYAKSKLVIMNPDGSDEQELLIPNEY